MSYDTEFKLTARKLRNKDQFDKLVEELTRKDILHYALDEGHYDEMHHEAEFYPTEGVHWYQHAEDMVGIAESFPNVYFELEGVGETFGDFWKEYYHDMDVERCFGEIVYEQPKKVKWNDLLVI